MQPKPVLSVIGLGKLGSPMLASFAKRGFTVIGVDLNQQFVDLINQGKAPVFEANLAEYLSQFKDRVSATTSYEEAILKSQVTFMIVPTPSDERGVFTNKYVLDAVKEIGATLKKKNEYHLVVLTSTVMPGSSDREIVPALEAASGKVCGKDFGYCYSPEFIALGNVIHDLLNPDFYLIGESDKKAGDMLQEIYSSTCENKPGFKRMNFVNAELTKISVNTFVTTKISFANMLAELCEQLPGGDIDVVSQAIGEDTRIGKKYLKGGTSYGGPCFPRDNIAFGVLCRSVEVPPTVAEATDNVNTRQASRIAARVLPHLKSGATVAVLGVAYKTGTNFIERSQGIDLARIFVEKGYKVNLYDPHALETAKRMLGETGSAQIQYVSNLKDAVKGAQAAILTLPYDEFKALEPSDLSKDNPVVVDCWRSLDPAKFETTTNYMAVGLGPKSGKVTPTKEKVLQA